MNLKRQLVIVSLLSLSLPWAGCQYVREVEGSLRRGQEQALAATAQAVAAVLLASPQRLYPYPQRLQSRALNQQQLYFQDTRQVFNLDGYADDWQHIASSQLLVPTDDTFAVSYQGAVSGANLYLFLTVRDPQVIYHNPALSAVGNGDRLVLQFGNNRRYEISTSGAGSMNVSYEDADGKLRQESAIKAYWQELAEGYAVELEIPQQLTGGMLGFYIVDAQPKGKETTHGTLRKNALRSSHPPWLVYENRSVQQQLKVFNKPGLRLQFVDVDYWKVAAAGELTTPVKNDSNWVMKKLYRALLSRPAKNLSTGSNTTGKVERAEVRKAMEGEQDYGWYSDADSNRNLLSVATPLILGADVIGAVVAEESSELFLAFTDSAFNKLLLLSLLTFGLSILVLLGYASWLSLRVRRLSQGAQQMLNDDGSLRETFPQSTAQDEIGELARSYAELLQRIREYTEYLRTLSRKLSHELRTPLAIVHSSLDNLQSQTTEEGGVTYIRRAKDGAKRLSLILTAMSEASRVEESIQSAEPRPLDISGLLRDVSEAYKDVYPRHHIQCEESAALHAVTMQAVPELLVQMLDKLIANAVDFAPQGSTIRICGDLVNETVILEVINKGPPLPRKMQAQLFDNMVSLRRRSDSATHLGLGLHIVRLIVEYHCGSVQGLNLEDGSGVCFRVLLPMRFDVLDASAE